MKIKNLSVSFVIIMAAWLLLNWSFKAEIIVVGLVLSLLLSLLFCSKCQLFSEIKLTPKAFFYTLIYIFVFLIELIKANIDVTKRILSPTLPINPGVVKVETTLNSKMARLILANSITLTPGTFTIEIHENALYIHWIDVKYSDVNQATEILVRKFETYLKEIYD
ncbi:MAG: Na+/H+ antiporter subunit E [Bacteroidales bacterium]|nr:Na+/H+ antiporter subunit E [Bacteroidales bacterium]